MTMYLCECGHGFPLPEDGFVCPKCGSTSEGHRIQNGGLGRIFYIYEDYRADGRKPDAVPE